MTANPAFGVFTNQTVTFVVTAPSFAFMNLEDIFDFVWVRFESTDEAGAPTSVITNRLDMPTSMAMDDRIATLYLSELLTGRIVAMTLGQ